MENSNKSLGRLQRHSEFVHLRNTGRKLRPQSWLVFNYKRNDMGYLRLGITVGRKVANAVLRNKLKRWSREYARQFIKKEFNPSYDLCIVLLPSKTKDFYRTLTHDEFDQELTKVFQRFKPSQ